MASRREEQQESARLRVMRLLSDNPEISTRGVADVVGISNGSAYYTLKALVEKGFVKLESFIKRKRMEFKALRAEIKALEEEIAPTDAESGQTFKR